MSFYERGLHCLCSKWGFMIEDYIFFATNGFLMIEDFIVFAIEDK